jgi:predicted transcriptional regulator
MSVSVAMRVYGSEILVALIRHYRQHAGGQHGAASALGLPQQLVSTNTRVLIDTGVLIAQSVGTDRRRRNYSVDEARLAELLDALQAYSSGTNNPVGQDG